MASDSDQPREEIERREWFHGGGNDGHGWECRPRGDLSGSVTSVKAELFYTFFRLLFGCLITAGSNRFCFVVVY